MRRTIDRLQAARREDRGFTLIELLIVIVILGVLAAVVVFSVRGITDTGEQAACETEVKTVEVAVEAFYAQSTTTPKSYPGTLQDLVDADLLRDLPSGDYVTGLGADGAVNSVDCSTL